jgi:hypothetical protein
MKKMPNWPFYVGRGCTLISLFLSAKIRVNPRPIEVVISDERGLNHFYLGRGSTRMHTDKAKKSA